MGDMVALVQYWSQRRGWEEHPADEPSPADIARLGIGTTSRAD